MPEKENNKEKVQLTKIKTEPLNYAVENYLSYNWFLQGSDHL